MLVTILAFDQPRCNTFLFSSAKTTHFLPSIILPFLDYCVPTIGSAEYRIPVTNKITHSIGLAILWSMIILYIVGVTTQGSLARATVYLFNSARVSQDILI